MNMTVVDMPWKPENRCPTTVTPSTGLPGSGNQTCGQVVLLLIVIAISIMNEKCL